MAPNRSGFDGTVPEGKKRSSVPRSVAKTIIGHLREGCEGAVAEQRKGAHLKTSHLERTKSLPLR